MSCVVRTSPVVQCITGAALCLTLATTAGAQETVNYASVSGRVTDPQSAAVPGAVVTARHTETNVTREAATDAEGRFRFPYLNVGPYEVTVRLAGFPTQPGS